jgi:hypothetical protein
MSVNVDCGVPWMVQAARNVATTTRPETGWWQVAESR